MAGSSNAATGADAESGHGISFTDALKVWTRIALLSFGGPAGQIAVMHRILVEEKRWIGESRFLHALNYCMLLPGPEAQQLAVYIGWLLHKTRGGLAAGTLFVLPGFLSILALSYVYVLFGEVAFVEGLFFGLKAAVLALVLHAVVRIGRRALGNPAMVIVAVAAFVAIFFLDAPFPLIILVAAFVGYAGVRAGSPLFGGMSAHGAAGTMPADRESVLGDIVPDHAKPDLRRSLRIAAIFLVLWLAPVVLLVASLGAADVFSRIGIFFSQMAVVTFGGAYAVLSYVAQQAVETYGWLKPGEMLDGLGMAETTPGPLIMVVQFVGFMGAYRDAGVLDPMVAATLAALLTTWVTFLPCFLWIFLGAPYIEALRGNMALSGALSAITAAVVGVILNLAIWFAMHTIFREVDETGFGPIRFDLPVWASIDWTAAVLSVAAAVALFRFNASPFLVLGACAAAGVLRAQFA